jgi:hypothetical protein
MSLQSRADSVYPIAKNAIKPRADVPMKKPSAAVVISVIKESTGIESHFL